MRASAAFTDNRKGIKQFKSLKALKNFSLEDVRQYYDQLLKADVVFFKIISNRDSTEVAKLLHPITKEREKGRVCAFTEVFNNGL